MSLKVTWLGHAFFLIEQKGFVVAVDPWMTGNPKFPAGFQLPKVDAILVSHGHSDHCADAPDIAKKNPACKVHSMHEISLYFQSQGLPAEQCNGCNKGGTVDLGGGFRATMVHAVHSSSCGGHGSPSQPGGTAAGWVINTPSGNSLYHSGDTDVFSDMAIVSDLYHPNIALLCIGGHYTMGPKGAGYALNKFLLSVKKVVPMHYGTMPVLDGTPEELEKEVTRPGCEVLKMKPGDSTEFAERDIKELF